ncbi:helix-turn-helix domain-containing protein [Pseudodesulfovibrio tunisiensis]|uniref:helix-turn-helix domain-containing protein n=1 Tax=Pseudodesulfovibrio tunisiensis TaxID=463192 RepID=UPI003C778485
MQIKQLIQKTLAERGWTATKLAREAGVAPPVITRILSGERKGLHSTTIEKLWPFLFSVQESALPGDSSHKAA